MSFQKVTWVQSLKSIFVGLVAGLFTPNRIGELGGRLIYIKKENRSRAIYINSICSFSQLFITLAFGLIACLYLMEYLIEFINIEKWLLQLIIISLLFSLLFLYLKSDFLRKIIFIIEQKLKFSNLEKISYLSYKQRINALFFSVLRYFVFCTQFVLFITILEPNDSFLMVFSIVSVIFFAMAIIPSGWLSDLPIRTSICFVFFELFGFNGSYGVMASVCLWFLNLFLPSLIGLFYYKEFNKTILRR